MPPEHRKLFVAMDRFPGANTNDVLPGLPIPSTQGAKFIEFVRKRSATGIGIEQDNKSRNLEANLGWLDWWKSKDEVNWKKGKSHPHFVLPDWLCAAAIAQEFYDDFAAIFASKRIGIETADALVELYNVFKTFNLWSMDGGTISHIRAAQKLWTVPNDAREFIMARAEGSN